MEGRADQSGGVQNDSGKDGGTKEIDIIGQDKRNGQDVRNIKSHVTPDDPVKKAPP